MQEEEAIEIATYLDRVIIPTSGLVPICDLDLFIALYWATNISLQSVGDLTMTTCCNVMTQ